MKNDILMKYDNKKKRRQKKLKMKVLRNGMLIIKFNKIYWMTNYAIKYKWFQFL